MLFCVLGYFLCGIITKRRGISLKLLLIGEEYIFASISSIVIFLTLSFPVALLAWLIIYFLMNFIFRNNLKLISCIAYFEQNRTALSSRQLRLLSQLTPCVTSTYITSWTKDFRRLRKECLIKLDGDIHIDRLKFKCRILPFSVFASCIPGMSVALLTYGNLVESSDSFLMLLLENYAILSCVLCALYVLLYFSLVGNAFHYVYGHIKLFKIIFAVFSVIMYVGVTAISMNV